jgi:hypothetical protein
MTALDPGPRADASVWAANYAGSHVFAQVDGRFFESRPGDAPLAVRIEVAKPDPKVAGAAARMQMAITHQLRGLVRAEHLRRAPGWLDLEAPCDRDGFDFPTWAVTRRPFDWAEDEADLPAPPALEYPLGPRQLDLYLRPPASTVQ